MQVATLVLLAEVVLQPIVGRKLSGEDVDTLLQQFEAGMPLGRIAVQLGRTDGSIVARLVHAGALPDRETGYTLLRAHREEGGRPVDLRKHREEESPP